MRLRKSIDLKVSKPAVIFGLAIAGAIAIIAIRRIT